MKVMYFVFMFFALFQSDDQTEQTLAMLNWIPEGSFISVYYSNYELQAAKLNDDKLAGMIEYLGRSERLFTYSDLLPGMLTENASSVLVAIRETPYGVATSQKEINEKFSGKHARGASPSGMGYAVNSNFYFFMFSKKTFGIITLHERVNEVVKTLLDSEAIALEETVADSAAIYSVVSRNEFKRFFILPVAEYGIVLFADNLENLKEMFSAGTGRVMSLYDIQLEQAIKGTDGAALKWMYRNSEAALSVALDYVQEKNLPSELMNFLKEKQGEDHLISYISATFADETIRRITRESYSSVNAASDSLRKNKSSRSVPAIPGYPEDRMALMRIEKSEEKWRQDGTILVGELVYSDEALETARRVNEYYEQKKAEAKSAEQEKQHNAK